MKFWSIKTKVSFALVILLKHIGIATAGMLYYLVLGITTDPDARRRLQAFEFAFNENTIATNAVVNLMAW